jgi:hypothetical protein
MSQMICVVHRKRADLFEELSHQFENSSNVSVVFDRRVGDRRRCVDARIPDNRGRVDRRRYHAEVRLLGWMLTRQEQGGAIPLAEAHPV